MAELLILAQTPQITDALKAAAGWKRGHVVSVRPDGSPYGKEECPPKFVIIKVPGDPKDYRHLSLPTTTAKRSRVIKDSVVSQALTAKDGLLEINEKSSMVDELKAK